MKTILLIFFILLLQLKYSAQSNTIEYFGNSFQNKVIVLVVIAIISIYTYIKWTNENNRTEP